MWTQEFKNEENVSLLHEGIGRTMVRNVDRNVKIRNGCTEKIDISKNVILVFKSLNY